MLSQIILMSYFFSHNEPGYGGLMAGALALNVLVSIVRIVFEIAKQ